MARSVEPPVSEQPGTILAAQYVAKQAGQAIGVTLREHADGRRYLDVRRCESVPAINGAAERWASTRRGISLDVELLAALREALAALAAGLAEVERQEAPVRA